MKLIVLAFVFNFILNHSQIYIVNKADTYLFHAHKRMIGKNYIQDGV